MIIKCKICNLTPNKCLCINKPKAKKSRKCKTGKFTPNNPDKYVGDIEDIVYRSGWERVFMRYCDDNPSIIQWNSESVHIPYYSPLDKKMHKYWMDFYIKIKSKDGTIKQKLIEVKPHAETLEPVKGNKKMKTYTYQVTSYIRNQAKWKAAVMYAEKHGLEFQVITEKMMPSFLK